MSPGELKPLLTALVLPPAGPLLAAGAGLLWARRRRGAGLALAAAALLVLWLLSCQAVAQWLAGALLPLPAPAPVAQVRQQQAIVVLGGGVLPEAPEYGAPQPNAYTARRLRYAAWLHRQTGLPLAFAGGVGWAAAGTGFATESEVAGRFLQELEVPLRWRDERSRDTAENAARLREPLAAAGVRRIALVTDAWHLPRAVHQFRAAGFEVLPAPTGLPVAQTRPLLAWLPSAEGLTLSRQVLRERLGLALL
jgi:uncharacterized SAM-binding protein YcdF (DUF218 family)